MPQETEAPLDNFLPFLLRRLSATLNSAMTRDLKPWGINVPRWRVIAVLNYQGKCTISELTQLTSLTQPGVSQVVDQLETENLVVRAQNPKDNRRIQISLSQTGKKLYDDIIPTIMKYQDKLTDGLSPSEKDMATDLCRKMLANLES